MLDWLLLWTGAAEWWLQVLQNATTFSGYPLVGSWELAGKGIVCVCAKCGKKLSPTKALENLKSPTPTCQSKAPKIQLYKPLDMKTSKIRGTWGTETPDKQLGIKAAANYSQIKEVLRLTGRLVEDISCHSCPAVEIVEVVTRNSLQRLEQSH